MKITQALRKWLCVFCGSLFLQIFFWAIYSLLEMRTWMCGISAVVSAIFYHFLQSENQTGLSSGNVFFSAIFSPFLLAVTVTMIQFVRYPNLNLLSAEQDGVSSLTETVSLYAARLIVNGIPLLIFAPIDRTFRQNRLKKEVIRNERETKQISDWNSDNAPRTSDSMRDLTDQSGY